MGLDDEYNALRSEIIAYMQINAQTTWSTVLATGAILTVSLADPNRNPFVCLAPLCLIIPSMIHSAERTKGALRIGAYIATFHEIEQSEIRWETRNWQFVTNKKTVAFANPLRRFLSVSVLFGLAIICLILAWSSWKYSWIPFIVIAVVVVGLLCWVMRLTINVSAHREEALKVWEAIKDAEIRNSKPKES